MKSPHRWIILYDIRDPARLRRVAKATESFALRVQKSVFEAYGGQAIEEIMFPHLKSLMEKEDSVAFIPLCNEDWAKSVRIGKAARGQEDPGANEPLIL